MKNFSIKALSVVLVLMMLFSLLSANVSAANSPDVSIIKNVEITGVHIPYAGYRPDYAGKLGSSAYTFDDQLDDDPNVYMGKWWYDETDKQVVMPSDTFKHGHVYTFTILLVACEGYEFQVDNYDTPFLNAYVNGEKATVYDELTSKHQAMIEYAFEPCDYNYEIGKVNINVTEPVPGGYPDFNVEIKNSAVVKGSLDSPHYIYGVAWYDCKTHTFMNPSDPFEEEGVYEVIVVLTTLGDYYFKTKNEKTDVIPYINGKEGISDGAGKNDAYHILASYTFGDIREEVSYVEITNIKEPAIGASPVFTAAPVKDKYVVNGVFWTDVTNSSAVSLKETDEFQAGHTYKLEVWVRANEKYKFSTDEDGYIDIMALVGGHQADVILPGSEVAAELALTFTLSADTIVSKVEVMYVDAPVEGKTPDYDAFCVTRGCNVSQVEWYDVTEGKGTLMAEDDAFEAGRSYRVIVRVDAEGNYTYETDDIGANVAHGIINGEKAIAYSSYDNTYLELGLNFAPCAENPDKPVFTGLLGDADEDTKINIKDATAIQKHIAGLITLTETGVKLADADCNSDVNIKDATAIQKHIAGIETGFNIGQQI